MPYKVTGAVAVLKLEGGGERYFYEGALVPDGACVEESIAHSITVGMLTEVEAPAEDKTAPSPSGNGDASGSESKADEGVYKDVSVKELKAEIEKRNADRGGDTKIVPAEPGNRPEIVAALLADDAK